MTATNALGAIGHAPGWGAPASRAFSITPNDSTELSFYVRGIWVGTAGNVTVTLADDTDITFVGAVAGSIIPVVAKKVKVGSGATETTADNLIGLH